MHKLILGFTVIIALAVTSNTVCADNWKNESGQGWGPRGGETPGWARGRGYWDGHFKHQRFPAAVPYVGGGWAPPRGGYGYSSFRHPHHGAGWYGAMPYVRQGYGHFNYPSPGPIMSYGAFPRGYCGY